MKEDRRSYRRNFWRLPKESLKKIPFNLIGKMTMAFSTGHSWCVLKFWYTCEDPEEGFRRLLADVPNQRVHLMCDAG